MGNIARNAEKNIKNSKEVVDKDYCDPNNNIEYKICYKNYSNKSCLDNTYNKNCVSKLSLTCTNYETGCTTSGIELSTLPADLVWSYNAGSGSLLIGKKTGANYWNGTCLVVDKSIEFNISNLELVDSFLLSRVVFDDYISVILNGNIAYVGPDNGSMLELFSNGRYIAVNYGTGTGPCERSTIWNQYVGKDLKPFLKVGKNVLQMRVIISGGGQGSMEFLLKNRCCKETAEHWTENCSNGKIEDKCNLSSKICTKKDQTLRFEGLDVVKKCTEYDQQYICKAKDSCFMYEDDCSKIDISKCSLEIKESMDDSNSLEKFTYKCLVPAIVPNVCNVKIDCLDGNCNDLEPIQDNSQDMLNTLSILSTLNESVKTIKPEDLTMLNGEGLKCRKSTGVTAAFRDCCGDENWGNSFADCNSDEEKLKAKREANACTYIGSYCNEEINVGFNKVCVEKEYSYCCFNNKFSKIIGNATRQQGFQTWGDAENTNCKGILIEQLQYLDFSKIDFSELYNDIKSSINQTNIDNKIEESLKRLQNGF